jgi:ABC-type taurine transport system ATPase subunit
MQGLLLERLPVPGVPAKVRIDIGEQRSLVVADAARARWLADLVSGIEQTPPGVTVKAGGAVRLVPAEGGLLPHLTVLGNIIHGHTVAHRVTRRAAADESRVTGSRCGLEDVLDRYPHEITSGRRRLAGVARALRAHPAVIVLEDAAGLPTWDSLLRFDHNPELWSAALLLISTDAARTNGFRHVQ